MLTTVIFPDQLNIAKSMPLYNRMTKPYLIMTDLFPKYMKKLFSNNFIIFF